jgi:hypothetical protein
VNRALLWLVGGLVLFVGVVVLIVSAGELTGGILTTILLPIVPAALLAAIWWDVQRRRGHPNHPDNLAGTSSEVDTQEAHGG